MVGLLDLARKQDDCWVEGQPVSAEEPVDLEVAVKAMTMQETAQKSRFFGRSILQVVSSHQSSLIIGTVMADPAAFSGEWSVLLC